MKGQVSSVDAGANAKGLIGKTVGLDNVFTATANAVAVAEHVLFMLLSISKRKNMYDDSVKTGKFNERNKLPKTIEIWGKNILIAGFGRIGQCLIKRCLGIYRI